MSSQKICAADWDAKRSLITRLYQEQEWPLKHVIRALESGGFSPSETQLRSRLKIWGIRKPSRRQKLFQRTGGSFSRISGDNSDQDKGRHRQLEMTNRPASTAAEDLTQTMFPDPGWYFLDPPNSSHCLRPSVNTLLMDENCSHYGLPRCTGIVPGQQLAPLEGVTATENTNPESDSAATYQTTGGSFGGNGIGFGLGASPQETTGLRYLQYSAPPWHMPVQTYCNCNECSLLQRPPGSASFFFPSENCARMLGAVDF